MKIVLFMLSIFVIVAGTLPLVRKDHWTFRVFEYPRFQKFWLTLILILFWLISFFQSWTNFEIWIVIILSALLVYLAIKIYAYSPFAPKMVKNSLPAGEISLKIMVINVFQYNEKYHLSISLIKRERPDVFLMVETDQKWAEKMSEFKADYKYHIEIPLENTYGMLFYSRFPVLFKQVNYLIDKEIPSIIADIEINHGKIVRIYAIHPTPPVPGENLYSTERDAEILLVGKMAKAYNKPCIVMGDLNDVAWSYTNELFLKISQLSDPRRGRGMFSTFHAQYLFLRWPLDHIFLSDHFRLAKMQVHKNIGSDHFPISAHLYLDENNNNEKLKEELEDTETANEKIQNGFNY